MPRGGASAPDPSAQQADPRRVDFIHGAVDDHSRVGAVMRAGRVGLPPRLAGQHPRTVTAHEAQSVPNTGISPKASLGVPISIRASDLGQSTAVAPGIRTMVTGSSTASARPT